MNYSEEHTLNCPLDARYKKLLHTILTKEGARNTPFTTEKGIDLDQYEVDRNRGRGNQDNTMDFCIGLTTREILLIEAKKEGKYFELPKNKNKNELRRFIITEELLTNKEIEKALMQVKAYAEDLGCSYVCITNGHEWIFTHINPQNKPWKKQPSIVITKMSPMYKVSFI